MKFLLGEKVGMSQIFDSEGNVIPMTLINVGPNVVLQIRTKEKDGYEAIQIGMGTKKEKNITKAQRGHFNNLGNFRYVREVRIKAPAGVDSMPSVGDVLKPSVFQEKDKIRVSGITKAKGFQGVVKRHGFHGAPASHGTKHAHRQPGSIGATWPQRVIKGMRMAGRMGGVRSSVRNLTVVAIDDDAGMIGVKGAVPGRRGTLLEIRG